MPSDSGSGFPRLTVRTGLAPPATKMSSEITLHARRAAFRIDDVMVGRGCELYASCINNGLRINWSCRCKHYGEQDNPKEHFLPDQTMHISLG